jgi:hypothetical protein
MRSAAARIVEHASYDARSLGLLRFIMYFRARKTAQLVIFDLLQAPIPVCLILAAIMSAKFVFAPRSICPPPGIRGSRGTPRLPATLDPIPRGKSFFNI